MDGQLNNSSGGNELLAAYLSLRAGGDSNPDNASINQTRGSLMSEANPPFHADSGHGWHVHPDPNFSSEMPYLGQPFSGSNPSLTHFGPSSADPSVYLGPAYDPSYTCYLSYFTGDGFYIPGADGYPQFASYILGSFSWSIPEVGEIIYVPAIYVPAPQPYIVTDPNAGFYLYSASNISSGTGQQTSGFVGQSSHDADVNNNNTVPASYGGNTQNLGYGHVASSSEGSAHLPHSRYLASTSGGDLHTWEQDHLSAYARPPDDRPRSRAAAVDRRNAIDDERQIVTGGTSSFLPVDLSDFYGNIRPNYVQTRNLGAARRRGLPEEIIANSLAEFMFVASEHDKDEKTCSICLEDWKNRTRMARVKKCGHEFHIRCIKNWLKIRGICPVCRTNAC